VCYDESILCDVAVDVQCRFRLIIHAKENCAKVLSPFLRHPWIVALVFDRGVEPEGSFSGYRIRGEIVEGSVCEHLVSVVGVMFQYR
jgi:hypothetical protein